MFFPSGRTPHTHVHRPAPPAEETVRVRRVATHEEIQKLAYSYWEAGGRREGTAVADWLQAERALNGK
jgi:hypothetical protein